MPIYEYKCTVCEDHFDIEQSFTDDTLTTLAGCTVADDGAHALKKVFSAVGISFKGDGFYRNDARSGSSKSSSSTSDVKDESGSKSSESSTESGSAASSDSGSSSSKSSSTSESTSASGSKPTTSAAAP